MKLQNYMEDAAREAIEDVLKKDGSVCGCERCKLDMIALVLNQLPSKYVVQDRGLAFAKIDELRAQFKVDLTVAAMKSKEKVGKAPRH